MAKTMLSVWAHPDDEAFGPAGLVRCLHDEGVRNVIITATRGEGGSSGEPPLAARAELPALRTAELQAACEILGVDRLELWDYPDGGLDAVNMTELRNRIIAVINAEQPHVVLTFGPDGIYGHPDHIAIHIATTQAFAQYLALHSHSEPPRLYYITPDPDTASLIAESTPIPTPLPPNVCIDVSQYADVKRAALQAHASQHQDWSRFIDREEWLSIVYLHRAYPPVDAADPPETALLV